MILCLADDPGGFDVVKPVYDALCQDNNYHVKLLLVGASKKKETRFAYADNDVLIEIKKYIDSESLELLVTGTSWGRTIELQAIVLCKEHNIKTISILDYWSNYSRRFFYLDKYIYPDYLFVPDKYALKGCVQDGIPREIIQVTGHPGLDSFVKRKVRFSTEKKALFLSQPLSALYGMKLGFNETTVFPKVMFVCKNLGYSVDVKFHPKETDKFKEQYRQFECSEDLQDCLVRYRVLIGMNSMALLQYSLAGMPVISFEPDMVGCDLCITNKLGITIPTLDEEQLSERLRNIENFRMKEKYLWMDGMSTDRCVNEIRKVVQ